MSAHKTFTVIVNVIIQLGGVQNYGFDIDRGCHRITFLLLSLTKLIPRDVLPVIVIFIPFKVEITPSV